MPNMTSPVQRLFNTCKEVFAACGPGIVPPPGDVERVKAALDDMRPEDVGLNPDTPYFRIMAAERSPIIAHLCLHECDKFSIVIFCLPASSAIPLHNHPGMTVFSKLLFGTMHIKSYDWMVDGSGGASAVLGNPQIQPCGVRMAKVKVNSEFTAPCETSILYPANGGNMHCLNAVTACAVLDVLGPPYSDPEGRHCTYYRDLPFTSFSVDGASSSVPEEEREDYAWLQEREMPEDFTVVGFPYRGPIITTND
ncbi:plant cysteine oxidase 2 isoform X1 [Rhodamnia argentea]|uniref:cysteine dioxygenase n=1 Tax=Rhodamnia argentea TaxID=178133 RepID=A0A8B8P8A7_9MYRT|nr:plant cysteine oxidase 2 isoform X1 [Rhodamnia argentea]